MRGSAGEFIEVNRALSDGVRISTMKIEGMPEWIMVRINEYNGGYMFSGFMRISEALTEIPFQLDRARDYYREWRELEQQEAKKRAESVVTENPEGLAGGSGEQHGRIHRWHRIARLVLKGN